MNPLSLGWSPPIASTAGPTMTDVALGYVGPPGIGALGMLLIVAIVLLIGLVGLVLHPVRLILRRRRRLREDRERAAEETASPS